MQAQFLCPPMLGIYLKEDVKEGEAPIRACLVIAWDDHCENYLVVDRETGEQRWLGLVSVQLDCDSIISTYSVTDTQAKQPEKSEAGHSCDDDDDEDRCPVCKQKMP